MPKSTARKWRNYSDLLLLGRPTRMFSASIFVLSPKGRQISRRPFARTLDGREIDLGKFQERKIIVACRAAPASCPDGRKGMPAFRKNGFGK
jgi:hypothetical protein